jgi:hypothetical protein
MSDEVIWRVNNRTRRWVAGIAGLLVLCIFPAFYIKSECKPEFMPTPAADSVTVTDKSYGQRSGSGQEKPISQFAFSDGFDGLEEIEQRHQTIFYTPREPLDWRRHFFCEINGADYVLAVFTIVLAISTILLWQETRRLAEGADGQSEKMVESIAAANRIANAGEDTVNKMKDTAERELRAYVAVGPNSHVKYGTDTLSLGYSVQMSNSGRTPAHKAHCVGRMMVLPYPYREGSLLAKYPVEPPDYRPKSLVSIQVGGTAYGNLLLEEEQITEEKFLQLIGDVVNRVYVFGIIKYEDVFKQKRTTKFCFSLYLVGPLDMRIAGFQADRLGIEYTELDNDAD